MSVYIAGIHGMLGRALKIEFESAGFEVFGASSKIINFLDFEATLLDLKRLSPSILIISAAKVGGIGANLKFPVEFLSENILIQTNLLRAAHEAGIEKVVFIASSCIYPKDAPQPITETSLMTGSLEESNAPYSIAKLAGIRLVQGYRSQYDRDWISVLPTNLYGPYDNFNQNDSHVIPSLMRKFQMADFNKYPSVEIWGDGSPKREFLHVRDLASAIRLVTAQYSDSLPINIGSPNEITINELAEILKKVTNFQGTIAFNNSYPNGAKRKRLDSSKIYALGWNPRISLEEGLTETYKWLTESIASGREVKI